MTRRLATIVVGTVAVLGLLAGTAAAGPPVTHTPVSDGPTPHVHHVDTPAGCVPIDAVTFYAVSSGLHRGASASGGAGPQHSVC